MQYFIIKQFIDVVLNPQILQHISKVMLIYRAFLIIVRHFWQTVKGPDYPQEASVLINAYN